MSAGGTGELVDPDLRAALAVLPDFGSLTNETLPAVRQLLAATAQLDPPIGLTVEAVSLPGAPGPPEVT